MSTIKGMGNQTIRGFRRWLEAVMVTKGVVDDRALRRKRREERSKTRKKR